MKIELIIEEFRQHYAQFGNFLEGLPKDKFEVGDNSKWSPAQQLDHIVISIQPLAKALANKHFIQDKFGKSHRNSVSNEILINRYLQKLAEGGKAVGPFLPSNVGWNEKESLLNQLCEAMESISTVLKDYSEEELDELMLPHPLLGHLTLREMMYFTNYHVTHHENNIKRLLNDQ